MKRYLKRIEATSIYIHAAQEVNPFDVTSTDTSYYDRFLHPDKLQYMQEEKNETGEVVYMTPNEYFYECSNSIFKGAENSSVDQLKRQRTLSREEDGSRTVDKYEEDMLKGDKFPLCYLDYATHNQEGLHRMYAAGQAFGWDKKFPVLVVRTFDEDRAREAALIREAGNFERYKFEKFVDEAVSELGDWYEPLPDDLDGFCSKFRQFVIDSAKQEGYDIDCDVEIVHLDDIEDAQILAYLTNYNGYQLPTVKGYGEYLGNMFHIELEE